MSLDDKIRGSGLETGGEGEIRDGLIGQTESTSAGETVEMGMKIRVSFRMVVGFMAQFVFYGSRAVLDCMDKAGRNKE